MATTVFSGVCATIAALLALWAGVASTDEFFAYPADVVQNPNFENARNRTPVFIPGKCSPNEILYPGDHDNDWVCDCRPGYVYYPPRDSCHALFEQGFCQPGEYVDLARPSMIVQCTKNTCTGNKVPYANRCVELYRNNNRLCMVRDRVKWVIGVNVTTLELDCIKGTPETLDIKLSDRNMGDTVEEPMKLTQPKREVIYYVGATPCVNGTKAALGLNELCASHAGN